MRSWTRGQRFTNPPPVPLRPMLRMRKGSVLLEMWKAPLPLMTVRLHAVLVGAGVDNLDVYSAELVDPKTGTVYPDYVAFNLIGLVSAADLGASEFQSFGGPSGFDFQSVAIDPAKTRGALMFRLAEATNGIVVHSSVRAAVEAAGIDTLTFIPPGDWAG